MFVVRACARRRCRCPLPFLRRARTKRRAALPACHQITAPQTLRAPDSRHPSDSSAVPGLPSEAFGRSKRAFRPHRRRVPSQTALAADEASDLTVVRLAQLQGPEEIPVLKPCACMMRARTMHPGRSAHVKVGFATSICNFGAEGPPTAPVRVHVAPATGSTPNAPLRSAPLGALHHGARWWESGQIAPSGEEERGGDEEPPDGDAALHVSPGSHTLRNACSRSLQLPPVALSACPRLNHEVGIAL